MGRTMYDSVRESIGYGEEFDIKGFIDDNLNALDSYANYPPLIGTISTYLPQPDDVFVCSIGGASRHHCVDSILSRGGVFQQIIHRTVRLGSNVKLGHGNFIGCFTTIGADATIGDYNMIQSYSIVGHDAKIGNRNRIDTHVTCVGGTIIEDDVNIHTGAVISHNVTVETGAHVGACSFVLRRVKAGTTVMGNPAKRLM